MKLLRREYRVVAAAARREVGLARLSDRLTLAVHAPAMVLRRTAAQLKQGRRAEQALYYFLRAAGVVWAFLLFGVEGLGTLVLYIFIWPAVLLANGVRLLVARLTKVTFEVRRGHEIPGGELQIDPETSATDTAVALTVLLPRAVCFGVSVLSLVILEWGTRTLGINPFPAITARSDLLTGRSGPLAAPLLILADAIARHGLLAGVGWLAGICAGLLAVPSVREIQMIRLSGGHDVGLGTRGLRIATSPLAMITRFLAAVESVLPFRGGPLYVTIYILPIALAILTADILRLVLPY